MFEEIVAEVKRWSEIIAKTAEHILQTQPINDIKIIDQKKETE